MIFDKLFEKYMKMYILVEHIVDTIPRKILGMSTSVQDLPENKPYGFWIDKSGNFLQVRPYGHDAGIEQIANKSMEYLQRKGVEADYNTLPMRYNEMFQMGWVRVLLTGRYVMYEMGKGDKQLTTSQKKFLDILAEMYELEGVVRDD